MKELMAAALAAVAGAGPAGQAGFAALYALACVLLIPASVLTLGAGAAFGLWRGFVLVSLSSTLGACAAMLVGRYLLRDWIARRLSAFPVFEAVRTAVAAEGWKVVALTRLSPVLPFAFLNYAYGLTDVGFKEYALASWLGMMPGTLLFVYLGAAAGEVARSGQRGRTPAEWAFFAAGLAATALAAWLVGKKAKAALATRVEAS